MPSSISHSMLGFCWRDIGHKALCPISELGFFCRNGDQELAEKDVHNMGLQLEVMFPTPINRGLLKILSKAQRTGDLPRRVANCLKILV